MIIIKHRHNAHSGLQSVWGLTGIIITTLNLTGCKQSETPATTPVNVHHYVQSSQTCLINGDGTQPSCATTAGAAGAWSGFTSIQWPDIHPGDTLQIAGIHTDALTLGASGSALAPIVIDGNGAAIDGRDSLSICVQDGGQRYVTIMDLEVHRCTTRGFYFPNSLDFTNPSGMRLLRVNVHDIQTGTNTGTPTCIWGYGTNAIVEDSVVTGCGDDGIWWAGDAPVIRNNHISNVGLEASLAGDCIQLAHQASDFRIEYNHCDHRSTSEKQCIIVNTVDSGGTSTGGVIANNVCLLPSNDPNLVTKSIYNDQNGVMITRNYTVGAHHGIWNSGTSTIINNIVTGFRGVGIMNMSTAQSLVAFNTVISDTGYGTYGIESNNGNTEFANNIVVGADTAFGGFGLTGINSWNRNLHWNTAHGYSFYDPTRNAVIDAMNADPLFVGPFGGLQESLTDALVYRVSPSSPAVGYGVAVSSHVTGDTTYLNVDYSGSSRASPPTTGALEP